NPLFVRALLATLTGEGVAPVAEQALRVAELGPEAVSRAISLRLLRLSAEGTALVRTVVVLGDGASLGQAAALAELELEVAAQAARARTLRPAAHGDAARVRPPDGEDGGVRRDGRGGTDRRSSPARRRSSS